MLYVHAALRLTRPASRGATVLRAVREDQHSICSQSSALSSTHACNHSSYCVLMLCVCAALQLTRPASCGATVLRAVREDQHSICSQ